MLAAVVLIGSLTLHPCADSAQFWCGALVRPLDPSGRVRGTIAIAFRWSPRGRHDSPDAGTIVAAEGGPGYPSSGSRDGYRTLFGPLLNDRNLLLMDNRGTGASSAIDCPALQSGAMSLAKITGCAEQLGAQSDLFGTALAADDLAALLQALSLHSVDLYGDSYGTFFAQVFAARHPSNVRSLVLDGAFPAVGDDPWYPTSAPAIVAAFARVCLRSPTCAALPGTTRDRIEALLATLRKGARHVTPSQLAFVMDSAGLDPLAYRDLDAAARAFLASDFLPLQRLTREAERYEEQPAADPRIFSNGLFAAVSCSDYPQAYDMRRPLPQRYSDWQSTLSAKQQRDPNLYAPFTIDEWLSMPPDYAYVPMCLTWPVASAQHPPGSAVPAGAREPDVPTLVLTGDLDTITTPAEGDAAAAAFPRAQRVIVVNTGHVTAVGDVYHCASVIVRDFIAGLQFNRACATSIPPLRLVSAFARTSGDVIPASPIGRGEDRRALRLTADAAFAADDALSRAIALGIAHGDGLRGGTFDATSNDRETQLQLRRVRWTSDLPVSGVVAFDARTGAAQAHLFWKDAALRVSWNVYRTTEPRQLHGTIQSHRIDARMFW